MPPKKKVPSPTPEPQPVLDPEALVMRNMGLQQVITIMLNGSRNPQFVVHAGLMQQIHTAFRKQDPDAFLLAVQTYLEQAVAHVAQSGKREEIPGRMENLTQLVEQAGLPLVARRVLSVVHAI